MIDKIAPDAQKWGVIGLLVIIVLWYLGRKLGNAAEQAIDSTLGAINPVSDQNIFYGGTNAVGSALSGQEDWTLGGWAYDLNHPWQNESDPTAPENTDSVFGYLFGGNNSRSLGSDIYDLFNDDPEI